MFVFFFKQKTAYEMRISDWSSDVCSSDLLELRRAVDDGFEHLASQLAVPDFQLVRDHLVEADRLGHRSGKRHEAARHQHRICAMRLHRLHQGPRPARQPPALHPAIAQRAPCPPAEQPAETGTESCRERVCEYVSITV